MAYLAGARVSDYFRPPTQHTFFRLAAPSDMGRAGCYLKLKKREPSNMSLYLSVYINNVYIRSARY